VKAILMILIPLTLITGMGIFYQGMLREDADEISLRLEKLTEDVSRKNWEKATAGLAQFNKVWQPVRFKWQILIDHAEVDRIDESLARIKKMISVKEQKDCLVEIAVLQQCFLHIPEKEKLSLSNIF